MTTAACKVDRNVTTTGRVVPSQNELRIFFNKQVKKFLRLIFVFVNKKWYDINIAQ